MKKIAWILFGIALLSAKPVVGASDADKGIDPGDIRLFNSPYDWQSIKVQIYTCEKDSSDICPDNQLKPLGAESPVLKSADYHTFHMDHYHLPTSIYVKIYDFDRKQWSPAFMIIKEYIDRELPFYQLICWWDKENPARCT